MKTQRDTPAAASNTFCFTFINLSISTSCIRVIVVIYLLSTRLASEDDDITGVSFGLGSPAMISIYYYDDLVQISPEEKGFSEILAALEETLRRTGQFTAPVILDCSGGVIKGYMDAHRSAWLMEVSYTQPFQLHFIDNRNVDYFLIDLEKAAFLLPWEGSFKPSWEDSFQFASFPLAGCEELSDITFSLGEGFFTDHPIEDENPGAARITGYVMAEKEKEILVTNYIDTNAYWVAIPDGMETPPSLGQQVEVIFDRVISYPAPFEIPGKVTATRITIVEPPDYPGARLMEQQAVRAALEALPVQDQLTVWTFYWLDFNSVKQRWTVTFNSQWTGEIDLAIDDVTGRVSVWPVNISEDDIALSGSVIFGESGEKIKQLFGKPLSRVEKGRDRNIHDPDSYLLWESWVYQDIEFTFFSVRKVNDPALEFPDRLHEIKLTGPGYATARGARVGDSLEQVYEKYSERRGRFYENTLTYGDPLFVQFILDGGKVKEIKLGVYFD